MHSILAAIFTLMVDASQQGLYISIPDSGQLQSVDWITGNTSCIGTPLARQGWIVPNCTPSAIDPTGKWFYTLARNSSNPSRTSPWYIVSAWLADGSTRTAAPLPPSFPSELGACDFALTSDGGWHVYIAVQVSGGTSPASVSVLAGIADFTFPVPPHSFTVLVNTSIVQLGIGSLLLPPSIASTPSTLWIAGQRGIAGVPLAVPAGSPHPRRLILPSGEQFGGLHSSPSGRVYGVLSRLLPNGTVSTALASLMDTGTGTPLLVASPHALPPPFNVTGADSVLTALMTDKSSIALLTSRGELATANASSGQIQSFAHIVCCDKAPGPCPSSMSYESFVF
jgi:hypothetical protein